MSEDLLASWTGVVWNYAARCPGWPIVEVVAIPDPRRGRLVIRLRDRTDGSFVDRTMDAVQMQYWSGDPRAYLDTLVAEMSPELRAKPVAFADGFRSTMASAMKAWKRDAEADIMDPQRVVQVKASRAAQPEPPPRRKLRIQEIA